MDCTIDADRAARRIGGMRLGGGADLMAKAFLAVALFALTGCASGVTVSTRPSSTPLAVSTVEPEPHDLAIIGVDFDPSLEYEQVVADGGVSLMVAVQNSGLEDAFDVQVTARLIDPEDDMGRGELLNETVTLGSVAGGELAIVRFPQVSMLPLRPRYRLEIQIAAITDEHDLSDNFRAFDITLTAGD